MPLLLPPSVGRITIAWDLQVANVKANGVVKILIPTTLYDTTDHVIIGPSELTGTVVNGVGSLDIPDPNDPDVSPQGWAPRITIDTDVLKDTYDIVIPPGTPAGSTVYLANLARATTPPVLVMYALASDLLNYVPKAVVDSKGDLIVGTADNTVTRLPAGSNGQALVSDDTTPTGLKWAASGASTPDATTTVKGIVQLAGDLGGTAAAPTVPGLASKVGSVSAADSTITVGGTATAPTVGVNAIPESKVTNLVTDLAGKTPTSRLITAGTGLTGGGDLSADRTLAVSYGTTAGTAAQGNDSRITGAVQASTATAKGDLFVATAAGTVVRLPVGADGQVLTGDSTQPAGVRYATPASGGGATFQIVDARITSGDVAMPNTSGAWAKPGDANGLPTDFRLTLTGVQVGDWVEIGIRAMRNDITSAQVDIGVQVGSSIVRYLSSGTSTPAFEGDTSWYPNSTFRTQSAPAGFYVTSGDLDSGQIRFVLANKSAGSGTLYASTNYPFWWVAKRWRP